MIFRDLIWIIIVIKAVYGRWPAVGARLMDNNNKNRLLPILIIYYESYVWFL